MSSPQHYTVVFLHEENGTVSASLPDLPGVYASADTLSKARVGIRQVLAGYLATMAERGWAVPTAKAEVGVMRVEPGTTRPRVRLVGIGALMGSEPAAPKPPVHAPTGAEAGVRARRHRREDHCIDLTETIVTVRQRVRALAAITAGPGGAA